MEHYLDWQRQVLECTLWLSEHGYFGSLRGTGGNVSVRIPEEDAFAITPSSRPYRTLSPADICIVDFDQKRIEGPFPPSMEAGMHLAVYQNRPDIHAVVHTHQPRASVFALAGRAIPALFDEVVMNLGRVVAVVDYGLSGSHELASNVAAKLSNGCYGYLLQNHGALCLGATLDQAWLNAELLEKTAEAYLGALSMGGEVPVLSLDIQERLAPAR